MQKADRLRKANLNTVMKPASYLNRVRPALFLSLVFSFLPAQAAIVSRSGLLEVSSVTAGLGSAFVAGDVFTYTLSYDDAFTDVDSDPGYAEFTGALTSLTIAPQTLRSGIWTPTGEFGNGSVYAEDGAQQSWYFDVTPLSGFGSAVNGYEAVMFAMGFGGLPANADTGSGQTLGQVTGTILDSVSAANNNVVELGFELGMDSQLVTFNLTTFHAPEPGRTMLLLGGLAAAFVRRRRR